MMDLVYLAQKVCYYMMNPEQTLPVESDVGQAAEIEKMRNAISDFCDGRRKITSPRAQQIATETVCLEIAKQMLKDQRGGR